MLKRFSSPYDGNKLPSSVVVVTPRRSRRVASGSTSYPTAFGHRTSRSCFYRLANAAAVLSLAGLRPSALKPDASDGLSAAQSGFAGGSAATLVCSRPADDAARRSGRSARGSTRPSGSYVDDDERRGESGDATSKVSRSRYSCESGSHSCSRQPLSGQDSYMRWFEIEKLHKALKSWISKYVPKSTATESKIGDEGSMADMVEADSLNESYLLGGHIRPFSSSYRASLWPEVAHRASYQKELAALVRESCAPDGKEAGERAMATKTLQNRIAELTTTVAECDEKMDRLAKRIIQDPKSFKVPRQAIEKARCFIKRKKEALEAIRRAQDLLEETKQRKLAVNAADKELVDLCESPYGFYVCPAWQVLLGAEHQLPKNKPILLINSTEHGTSVFLGCIYANKRGELRLARSMSPIHLDGQALQYSNKGIVLEEGRVTRQLTLENAPYVANTVLQSIRKQEAQKALRYIASGDDVPPPTFSPGINLLLNAQTPEAKLDALMYMEAREPQLLRDCWGMREGPSDAHGADSFHSFLPSLAGVDSVLRALSHTKIMELVNKVKTKPHIDNTFIDSTHILRNNVFVTKVKPTSVPNSSFYAAFVTRRPVFARALHNVVTRSPAPAQQTSLLDAAYNEARQLAELENELDQLRML